MRESFVRSFFALVISTSILAGAAQAQSTFPYYGPSAFVSQPVESGSVLEPPTPPAADGSTEALDAGIEQRLKALEDMEKRFGSLEEDWNEFQDAQKEKKDADAEKTTFKLNGRVQLDYWNFLEESEGIGFFEHDDPAAANYGTDPEDRLEFRRVWLEFSGTLTHNFSFRATVDVSNPSDPGFKDLYLSMDDIGFNQMLKVGIQKRPISLDQWDSSRHIVFLERPTVGDAFDEYSRLLGACVWGYSDAKTWTWQYGVFTLENPQDDGEVIGDSMQLSGNGRLGNTFLWRDDGRQYAYFGSSIMVAHPDGDATDADTNGVEARFRARPEARSDNRWVDTGTIVGTEWYEISGLEAVYNDGPLQVVGEWMTNWTHRDDVVAGTPADLRFQGGYVYVSYVLTGEHIPWDRESGQIGRLRPFNPWTPGSADGRRGWGALNVAARYSFVDLTDEDVLGGLEQNVTCIMNWHWTAYAKLQYQLGWGEVYDRAPVGGYSSGHFWTSGLRMAFDF